MQEINLYDLLKHYAKYWLIIVLFTLAGLAAGVIYNSFVQKPMYKSNATLLVVNKAASSTADKTTTINNYLELLKSRRVLDPVIANLSLDQTYEQLSSAVSTSNDKDTEVVKLTISATNPEKSKQIVDATVASFSEQVNNLYATDTLQVIDSANLPRTPYNVRKSIQLALFTAAGFLASIIIVFFMYDYQLSSGKASKPKVTKKKRHLVKAATTKLKSTLTMPAKAPKKPKAKDGVIVWKPVRNPKTGRFDPKPKAKTVAKPKASAKKPVKKK